MLLPNPKDLLLESFAVVFITLVAIGLVMEAAGMALDAIRQVV